jgi:hypothetical protein
MDLCNQKCFCGLDITMLNRHKFLSTCNICTLPNQHIKKTHAICCTKCRTTLQKEICCKCVTTIPQIKKDIIDAKQYLSNMFYDPSKIICDYWDDHIENSMLIFKRRFDNKITTHCGKIVCTNCAKN